MTLLSNAQVGLQVSNYQGDSDYILHRAERALMSGDWSTAKGWMLVARDWSGRIYPPLNESR